MTKTVPALFKKIVPRSTIIVNSPRISEKVALERCPHCQVELLFEGSEFCDHCNGILPKQQRPTSSDQRGDDDDTGFVVTEAESNKAEFVGSYKPSSSDDEERLGTQSSVELMLSQAEAGGEIETPETENHSAEQHPGGQRSSGLSGNSVASDTQLSQADKQRIRKLSSDELKSVEKGLYSSSSYLTEEEKLNLVKHMSALESIPRKESPVQPKGSESVIKAMAAEPDQFKPAAGRRGRDVAYFVRNFVVLRGDIALHDQDELTVNERIYLLRKKKLSPKMALSLAGGAFGFALLVIGSFMISNAGSGTGTVVGVVLDSQLRPFLQGATVQFPDLGRTYATNAQGFFRTDALPAGSHKIEYLVDGTRASVDYATVASGEVTTISLKPEVGQSAATEDKASAALVMQTAKPAPTANTRASVPDEGSETDASSTGARNNAKLTLAANVGGVHLTLDGVSLGVGNTTYTKLKAGVHEYVLSKEGYESVSGTVELESGQSARLEATLSSTEVVAEPVIAKEEQSFAEGTEAMKAADVKTAIEKFSEAIAINPNYVSAYKARAEAHEARGDKTLAHDDYIRIAEISRFRNETDKALTAYGKAISLHPGTLPGYLGRASLYLDKNEEIAATQDFEMVLKLDKRNLQAYMGLGEVRFNQGNFKKAIKYFKDAKDLDPTKPQVYEYLMLCYMSDDDLKNVKKSYEKFKEVASQEEQKRLATDGKFNAVLRIVEAD